ncbi:YwiC-like family protein [Macrococcus brunensis]|uniref:YwiC-like family protein n=1 Tax=Macrococcus brunensis TaxID=198483 RepID=UPI001EF0BBF1|nr:YwiC-like family protein [Macrococcus brunensis]ULG72496.1 YwiC-like family protein [Macrococcus brunensis]ULG74750.1 YwiC-like family protein [Macrococcus brunensis]
MKFKKPNQHGVWAMLIMPFLFGVFAGEFNLFHLLFILGWFLVFFATDNLLFYIKKRKKDNGYLLSAGMFGVLAALCLGVLILRQPSLLFFFGMMIPFGGLNIYFASIRDERNVLNDLSAVIIFSIAGCISYFIGHEELDGEMIKVFVFSFLYFVGTILYVKTMIREKRNVKYKWLSFSYHMLLVVAGFWFHVLMGIAVVPSLIRAVTFYGKNYKPMKIGIVEIANACFVTFFVALYFLK